MRIRVRLPQVQPDQYGWPTRCSQPGCHADTSGLTGRKGSAKHCDGQYRGVIAYRQCCLNCERGLRLYPRG